MAAVRRKQKKKSGILLQHLEDVSWRVLADYTAVVRGMAAADYMRLRLGPLFLKNIYGKKVQGDAHLIRGGLTDHAVAALRNWSN